MTTIKTVKLGTLIKPAQLQKCGNDDYPVLSMTMHNGLVFQSDKFKKSVASQDKSTYKVVHRNQLVIGFPIDEGVLATQRITDAGIVSPAYGVWDVDQTKIIPEFLEYALRSNRAIDYYKAKLRGSTARRRSLPTPTLLELDVPLPDIKQQKAALTTIHHAKNALDSRQEQLSKLDELVKARFIELFGNPICNDKQWNKRELKDVCHKITDGEHGSVPRVSQGRPFLNAKHIKKDGNIDWTTVSFVTDAIHNKIYKRCNPEPNDILMTTTGSIGNIAIVPKVCSFSMDRGITLLKINHDLVNTKYISTLLGFDGLQAIMQSNIHASAIGHLFLNQVECLPIILPPLSLQNQFAAFVEEVDKSKVEVQKALDQTQLLFDSLMQQYFG